MKLTPELCEPCGEAFVMGIANVLTQLKAAARGVPEIDAPDILTDRLRELRAATKVS